MKTDHLFHQIHWCGPNAHIQFVSRGTHAFLLAIEGNPKDSRAREPGVLGELVARSHARRRTELFSPLAPQALAVAISEELTLSDELVQPVAVLYAGLSLSPERIVVCTAGDIRVHLLSRGELRSVTRDHTLYSDLSESERLRIPHNAEASLRGTISRCLGPLSSSPPEVTEFSPVPDQAIVVCSSSFHRSHDPETYRDLLSDPTRWIQQDRRSPFGLLVSVYGRMQIEGDWSPAESREP